MMPAAKFPMRCLLLSSLAGLLVACSSAPQTGSSGGAASGPAASSPRPLHDGPPSYMQDVSQIPDAVPTPHTGAYKASPYTVLGQRYHPMQDGRSYREEGTASWYGTKFHGQNTANGELYDLYGMTAAHKTLPFGTRVRVTNPATGKSVVVRINDRGPYARGREIDVSRAAAIQLGLIQRGHGTVELSLVD